MSSAHESSAIAPIPLWKSHGLIIAVLLALGLFAWLPMSYYQMVGWPGILVWQLAFLALVGWGIWRVRQFQQPWHWLGYGLDGCIGLTALGLVLSSLLAPFRVLALWNVLMAAGYGLLLYVLRNGVGPGQIAAIALWRGSAIAVVGSAAISLGFWRPNPSMWQDASFEELLRNLQPLGHHNFVGGYFVLGLPLVVALALAEKGWRRGLAIVGAAIVAVGLYASGSRGALLGLVAWLVVMVLSRVWRSQGAQRRWFALGSLLVLAGVGVLLFSNPRVRGTLRVLITGQWMEFSLLSQSDGPLVDRIFMAQAGFNLFKDHPWFGVGPGNLSRVFNLYRPIEMGNGLDHVQQLHNTPIHFLGEMGLVGIGIYLTWLGLVGWLWVRLVRGLPTDAPAWQRPLVYGIGGSFWAYGVSSITDYQLENIAIALTLVINIALLLRVADAAAIATAPPMSALHRRLSSMGLLVLVALLLQGWLPFNIALALNAGAIADLDANRLGPAQEKFLKAATLAPWDPTAGALAAQQLIELEPAIQGAEDLRAFQEGIVTNLWSALEAAPNDAWFNHNLAVRLLPTQPDQAEIFASRAVELLPRNLNYTYYTLGLSYLNQDKFEAAMTAFALEGLVSPDFTTLPLWQTEPFSDFAPVVVEATLTLYDALLRQVPPEQFNYQVLYEYAQLLRWWHDRPLLPMEDFISPLTRAALTWTEDPEGAVAVLTQAIADTPASQGELLNSYRLLRAWLQPDAYLEEFVAESDLGADAEVLSRIREHIVQFRDLKPWLTSLTDGDGQRLRKGLAFAYRNREANYISLLLRPGNLAPYTLLKLSGLFADWSREFPELDRLVEAVKTAELGLPHPTRNGYRLSVELPPPPES